MTWNVIRRGFATNWIWIAALLAALPQLAVAGQTVPALVIGNASGAPGGTAGVQITLNGGGGQAETAQLDIHYDAGVLEIASSDCVKAARLADQQMTATSPSA